MKQLFRVLFFLFVGMFVSFGGLMGYGMYLTRKLPWQHPVFDTGVPADPGVIGEKGVLLFSKTNGFRHGSIEKGVEEIKKAGEARGWHVVSTENGAFFNDDYLKKFKAVVFLSTTGDILTPAQEKAFEKYMAAGGGYVGIHSASDTEYDWKWYDAFLGTHFKNHSIFPHTPEGELTTEINDHPTTRHLPAKWKMKEEWYNFNKSVRSSTNFKVLVSVDEKTYNTGETKGMGGDHPISWIHETGQGRMFYTALGHHPETYTDPNSLNHILTAIEWAAKMKEPLNL